MAKNFQPWVKYPPLTEERLSAIAAIINSTRRQTVLLHNPENGDNAWSLGCRVYARICFAITRAAERYDWLTIRPDLSKPLRFVFVMGGIPVRFYHGDAEDPPSRFLATCEGEQYFLDLFFEIDGVDISDGILRFAIETDDSRQVSRVALVEMDVGRNVTGIYTVPLTSPAILPLQAKGVSLPPAQVEPLQEQREEEGAEVAAHTKRNAG